MDYLEVRLLQAIFFNKPADQIEYAGPSCEQDHSSWLFNPILYL